MNMQSSRVVKILTSKEMELRVKAMQERQEIATFNAACAVQAGVALRELLGDTFDELSAYAGGGGHTEGEDGRWESCVLHYQSDVLQLARIYVLWSPATERDREKYPNGTIDVMVHSEDGPYRRYCKTNNTMWSEILVLAHQCFVAWKEADEARKRKAQSEKVSKILGWNDANIAAHVGYNEAWQRICALREIDPNLAEMKWSVHCRKAIDDLADVWKWQASESEEAAMRHYEMLLRYDAGLAAQRLEEWRLAVEAEAKRQAAKLEAATAYTDAIAVWREACQAWAEEWTKQLWQAWEVVQVRYAPLRMPLNLSEDEFVQTIAVINPIDECVGIGAALTQVFFDGQMSDIVIGAFLDARVTVFNEPNITEGLAYHRTYRAGEYAVNVPAILDESHPDAAPERPVAPEGVQYVTDRDLPY